MHVTSNPYFAFHDDVFPAFSKNAVAQPRFPLPSFFFKTIIPNKFDNKFFSSLEELKHISTIELEFTRKKKFELKIDFQDLKLGLFDEMEILEFKFFDETTLFNLGIYGNASIWMDSDYFNERFLLKSTVLDLKELGFFMNFENSVESSFVQVFEEEFDFMAFFELFIF